VVEAIVDLTRKAEPDFGQTGGDIARDNPRRAMSFIRGLRDRCMGRDELPFAFALVPRYQHLEVRHRVYRNDQIFYRVVDAEQRIDVLHVIHGTCNFAATRFR
jgi:toxin ParE1/3/4